MLTELVLGLCLDEHSSSLLGSSEFLSEARVLLDVLLDQLIHGYVQHVILDAEIGAGGVDGEAFLVVDEDDAGFEHPLEDVDLGLLGCRVCAQACHVTNETPLDRLMQGLNILSGLNFLNSEGLFESFLLLLCQVCVRGSGRFVSQSAAGLVNTSLAKIKEIVWVH